MPDLASPASDPLPDPLPLDGVRVVSLAGNIPGPVALARLRDLGATTTKVENPAGDPLAAVSPEAYRELVEGTEVVVLDLRTAAGRAELDARLEVADVLLTSFRPGSLSRLGLAWPSIHGRWPRLCQLAVVGGAGNAADTAGHDLTYQAAAGTLSPPANPVVLVADLAGAERAVSELLAALLLRSRTGTGSYREVSLETVCVDMARARRWGLTGPNGPLGGARPAYRLYQAGDGWVALAALEPHFLTRTLDALEVDGSAAGFERVLAKRTAREWETWGAEHDVPLARVR